jgi:transcription elongation factor Elf1
VTIYGGKAVFSTFSTTLKDGFFVSCTKCGWHSKVKLIVGNMVALLVCRHCGNKYMVR